MILKRRRAPKNAPRSTLLLLADPTRTDADIARQVGCDPKTVKSRRENPETGNSTGSNSNDGNLDAGNSKTGNSSENSPLDRDQTRDASNDDDQDPHTLAGQQEIEMYFNNAGGLVLKQHNWPDEDSYVVVAEPYTGLFLDKLCDVLGVPSTKDLFRR